MISVVWKNIEYFITITVVENTIMYKNNSYLAIVLLTDKLFKNFAKINAQNQALTISPICPSQMAVSAIGPKVNGGTSALGK